MARSRRGLELRGRSSGVVATLASLLLCTGCAGLDQDWNPFYVGRVYETDQGEASRVISAGPFWDDSKSPGNRETAFHPFWRRVETPHDIQVQVLNPLYESRWTSDESYHRFLVFSWARKHHQELAPSEFDYMLFPLLWYGNGPTQDEKYFALFPLFGSIKDFAAFAEVGFFLFPLYYYAKKDVSSPETIHNITPFIRWANGGPRDGTFHVLPFFGHWKYEGKYDRYTFLWPIFHIQFNRLDTDDPSRMFGMWPLFGLEKSERVRFLTILWPFFRFRTERVPRPGGLDGQPYEDVYYHQDFLWPLFRHTHTREYDHLRLFPFYSRYHSDEVDSQAFAIPFFWKRQVRELDWTKDTFDFVPLIHWEEKRWLPHAGAAPRDDDSSFKLWPLFQVKHEAGGDDFKAPVLLPLDTELYAGEFEANWSPLWELWHTHRFADGSTRGNAALRLVDWESRGGRSRFSLPLLYSYDGTPRRWSHSLLLGLIKFGGGDGGAELKLLGMPILTPDPVTR
jgi:hypothetical protein